MARGVRNPARPPIMRRSPITGQLVPQSQYRRELAQSRGFASTRQMVKATQAAKREIAPHVTLPAPQLGRVAAEVAIFRRSLGEYVEGELPSRRASNRLPPSVLNYIRSLGNAQYPIWRELYV